MTRTRDMVDDLEGLVELFDRDGNPVDVGRTRLDPDWHEWMETVPEGSLDYNDDEIIGAAITANNCGVGKDGFEHGNTCAKGGGALGKEPNYGKLSQKQLTSGIKSGKFLKDFEERYRGAGVENMLVIKPGTINSPASATLVKGTGRNEIDAGSLNLFNAIVTHNHPDGDNLSIQDIKTMARGSLRELRAVAPDGTVYSMKLEEAQFDGKPFVGFYEAPPVRDVEARIREVIQSHVTPAQAALPKSQQREVYSKVWQEFAAKPFEVKTNGGATKSIRYTFTETKPVVTANNCGTGAGGFQPGNTCGKGGDGGIDTDAPWPDKKSGFAYEEQAAALKSYSNDNYKLFGKDGKATSAHKHSVKFYTGSGHEEINEYLKGRPVDSDEDLAAHVKALDQFLDRNAGAVAPPKLFRAFRSRNHDKMAVAFEEAMNNGDLIELGPAYQSMTGSRAVAQSFLNAGHTGDSKEAFMLEIESKSALPFNNPDEVEYIPPRDRKYEVVDIKFNRQDVRPGFRVDYIKLREVDPDDAFGKPAVPVQQGVTANAGEVRKRRLARFVADEADIKFVTKG